MRILVTGGAGYIGSVVTADLLDAGYEVTVFDDLSTGHREAVDPRAGFVLGDVTDAPSIHAALETSAIDAVMHFAAQALVGKSMREPEAFYRANVIGGVRLLDAMISAGVQTIIFSSSCAVYGDPETSPIDESHATEPINPYGESKRVFEAALGWYSKAHQLRHVSLRYFNVCGATTVLGEDRGEETHLLPLAIDAALGRRELTIFGDGYPTPDGTCIRDYVHVSDIARAHRAALEGLSRLRQPAYNVGTGGGFSNLEVVDAVRRVTGKNFSVGRGPARAGDPARLVAAADAFARDAGWRARVTSLDEMVRSVWEWREAHPRGYAS